MLKVTICELNDQTDRLKKDWEGLVKHVRKEKSDLVLLPEMIFIPWIFRKSQYDSVCWEQAVNAHRVWEARFSEMASAVLIGSRPVNREGKRYNEGFVWDGKKGIRAVHKKSYLPDEEDFWEASWYDRGQGFFRPFQIAEARIGMLICTEIWFFQHARNYGQKGIHLIVHPRATGKSTLEKWLLAGRVASVVAGGFCISSNRINADDSESGMGGMGWITGPNGEVLALTSQKQPFITLEIDLDEAEHAKGTYPRYVTDLSESKV
ncbi:carbon-nitrogen hydrolase family protein [bacterium]|nr:carbon-nitrogen hydrolase family protein [bacterium]RQV92086.1 MAG: carbon-nitrogen hydrolase family protein [bacterium]